MSRLYSPLFLSLFISWSLLFSKLLSLLVSSCFISFLFIFSCLFSCLTVSSSFLRSCLIIVLSYSLFSPCLLFLPHFFLSLVSSSLFCFFWSYLFYFHLLFFALLFTFVDVSSVLLSPPLFFSFLVSYSISSSCLLSFLVCVLVSTLFYSNPSPWLLVSVFVFIYTLFPLTHTNILLHVFSLSLSLSLCMFVWVCPAELRNRVRLWLAGCVLKGPSLRLCSEKEREHGEGGSKSTSECAGVRAEKEKRGRFVLRWQGWKERRANARLFEAH